MHRVLLSVSSHQGLTRCAHVSSDLLYRCLAVAAAFQRGLEVHAGLCTKTSCGEGCRYSGTAMYCSCVENLQVSDVACVSQEVFYTELLKGFVLEGLTTYARRLLELRKSGYVSFE
jgi:hypothetical protein